MQLISSLQQWSVLQCWKEQLFGVDVEYKSREFNFLELLIPVYSYRLQKKGDVASFHRFGYVGIKNSR